MDSRQQESFEEARNEICRAPVLAKLDLKVRHCIIAGSSNYALEAVLLQANQESFWQPMSFVSRRLTEAESRYAQIEKVAPAIT